MGSLTANLMLPLAFLLDWFLGDPPRWPHPVRWMGRLIAAAEPGFRRIGTGGVFAGTLFTVAMVSIAGIGTFLAVAAASRLHPMLGWMLEVVLIFYALSVRSLQTAAMSVYRALVQESTEAARRAVAQIVGRDTGRLGRRGVTRAAVESVAENLVDGVISPLFYAALGGAALAMAYKMISTLDSMVGYKNERYIRFGKTSARLDDLANLIPARLSVPLIALAARILYGRRSGVQALKTAALEGGNHSSPNAGRPEAAFAGALEIRLGGPAVYHGETVSKPYLGTSYGDARPQHIPWACRLMVVSALLALVVACVLRVVVLNLFA
jgi:adenosylcobinamide-phosphate synthase